MMAVRPGAEASCGRSRGVGDVTETARPGEDVSLESAIPAGAVPLSAILYTEELRRRPSRPPEYDRENRALVALASALADSPRTILQTLTETILEVTESDSSGVSLLTADGKRFYWPALAGLWTPHVGGGTPRHFSPCGDVLDRNASVLMRHWDRRYTYFSPITPPVQEGLLVPFYVEGKAVGTIWVVMHDDRRKYDAEDERLLKSLSKFASTAYQVLATIDELRFQIDERVKAETAVRELASGLETQVRVRTEQLERNTRDLRDTNEALEREIAERKRAEDNLRRSETFLADAQRLSSTGSFSWRVETGESTWSEELYRIYGLPVGVPVTLDLIRTRIHPEDVSLIEKMKMADHAQGGGAGFEWQYRLLMPDHSIKYMHAVAHATRDQDGQLEYIAAVQDVTARKRSEEALDKARSELARVARVMTLGALTASVAHEVNQPLSGIITNASTCLRMLDADPPDVDGARETALRTIRDGHRASEVIGRLRSLFTRRGIVAESIDLNEATREVIALSLSELQRNRVTVRAELSEGLPRVTGDRVQLQQVILNLILNASDAMGGVEDRPRQLFIRTEPDGDDRVRLAVRDAGVGVDPKGVDRLFETFYTTKSGGMGIGLSVSRSIIESHQGRLWAAPNDGPGATFSFSIPLQARAQAHGGPQWARERPGAPSEASLTSPRPLVSVVDDDESVRESLPDTLRLFGFAVKAFSSAEEFLASDCVARTKCLVLDVAMPRMTGPELQQELASRKQEIPIVFITAHRDETVRPRLLAQGAVDCLFKPFSDTALHEAVDAAIRAG
jgi:signal transduction histidine kinase/CheY-like chemotaxis protein/GAF domain-containing protein